MSKNNFHSASNRQLKAGELIKRALVEVFAKDNLFGAELIDSTITVSEVRVSPDLKTATVFVFPFGNKIDKIVLMQNLKNIAPYIRAQVTKKIQLKFSIELVFKFDESFDNVQKIENILKSI
jgi:ribosome-binding factor A